MRSFDGDTADEIWRALATEFSHGRGDAQMSRAGQTQEMLRAAIELRNPLERWVVSRSPAVNPAFSIAEVVWIMAGRDDSRFLNFFNSQLPQFAGSGDSYHGAYGFRLRRHLAFDQLRRAYQVLSTTPNSRQVVLQIWDGRIDLPLEDGRSTSPDTPCNIVSMLKVRDGRLEWTQVLRSNDLFLGVPHNFVQFTYLQEILAGWIGLKVGTYFQLSDSLHVYERHLQPVAETQPVLAPANTDSIALPWRESEAAFQQLSSDVDFMIDVATSTAIVSRVATSSLAPAFRNLLRVLSAEALRRKNELSAAQEVMADSTNPLLLLLWNRWLARIERSDMSDAVKFVATAEGGV